MTKATDAELIPFGYAPGGYMAACRDCEAVMWDVDKRASRCRPCAVAAWEADKVDEPRRREDKRMADTLAGITRRQTFAAARRMAGYQNPSVRQTPNWVFAMDLFALGGGYAHAICREMGLDPDSTVATPWPPSPSALPTSHEAETP